MSNLFGSSVKFLIENNLAGSLKILLEEDEGNVDDIFSALDDNEEPAGGDEDSTTSEETDSEGESEAESSEESSDSSESAGVESEEDLESSEEDSAAVTKDQIEDLSKQLKSIADTIEGASEDGLESVESFISKAVSESTSRGSKNYNKKSINRFLFEDVEPQEIEDDIEALDRVLTKGTDFVDKFKKGQDVNISKYVDAAINAYTNFDSLFEKEKIVKQAAINVLVLNSGAKADANIKEFEEAFHDELSKKFGVDYDQFNIKSSSFKQGSGAVRQG